MSNNPRKVLKREKTTGNRELDNYVYQVQLSMAAILLPGRALMRSSRQIEAYKSRKDGQFILDQDAIKEARQDISSCHSMIADLWDGPLSPTKDEE